MTDVVCIRAGDLYAPEYVRNLRAGVRDHSSLPSRFFCFTDYPDADFGPGVTCVPLPLGTKANGWWQKMGLFHEALTSWAPTVFMDLDTVIVGNIDWLLEHAEKATNLMLHHDFWYPENLSNSIMVIPRGFKGSWIVNEFLDRQEGYQDMGGDNRALEKILGLYGEEPEIFQDRFPGKITNYKGPGPHSPFLKTPSPQLSIVCFHGQPKPHEVSAPWCWGREVRA